MSTIYVIRVDDSTKEGEREEKEGSNLFENDLTISVSFFQCSVRNPESQPK